MVEWNREMILVVAHHYQDCSFRHATEWGMARVVFPGVVELKNLRMDRHR